MLFGIAFYDYVRYAMFTSLALMMACIIGMSLTVHSVRYEHVYRLLGNWWILYWICFFISFAYLCIVPSPEVKEMIDNSKKEFERVKHAHFNNEQGENCRHVTIVE